MVRAPNFGLTTHLALSVPLPTQLMCNLVTANLMLRATWRWTIVPSNGGTNVSLHATETQDVLGSGIVDHLAHMQTLPYFP